MNIVWMINAEWNLIEVTHFVEVFSFQILANIYGVLTKTHLCFVKLRKVLQWMALLVEKRR